ncbi:MAG: LacI family DNA-binding transcriptional regulator [Stappiaceae bacterium]
MTLKQIAEAVGVAQSTCSRILNRDPSLVISDEKRRKVIETAEALNYVTRRARRKTDTDLTVEARMPVRSQPIILSHFLSSSEELSRPYFIGIRQGIEARSELYRTQLNRTNSADVLGTLSNSSHITGVICVGDHPRSLLEKLVERDVPVVLADPTELIPNVDYVDVDIESATWDICDWLAERGILRPAILGITPSEKSTGRGRRYRGYLRWMKEHGRFDEALVKPANMQGADLTSFVHEVFSDPSKGGETRADGLIVNTDHQAGQAYRALSELGLRIPDDVAVVGFNDGPVAQLVEPNLTSIALDPVLIGETAVDLLMERLSGRETTKHVSIGYKIIGRNSTPVPPS